MRLRVIDLETTGDAPPEHGVCEIGWCDVTSTLQDLITRPTGWVVGAPGSQLINPRRPMPPETAAVHHIIDEDVAGAPTWATFAPLAFPEGNLAGEEPIFAYAAHSAKFERRFITDELTRGRAWIDTYKCALRLWPEAPLHSNQGLRYWRKPVGLERRLALAAHRAGADAYVTAFHLRDLLDLAEVPELIKWSTEPALQVTCHIGKQRGMKWAAVDDGFLEWLLGKDFDEDVLFTARYWIEKREADRRREYDEANT